VEVELERERALEGEPLDVSIRLGPSAGAERIDVFLELSHGLEVAEGTNPSTLRLVEGEQRLLPLRLRCARWGAFRVGRIHLRAHDPFGMFRHEAVVDRRQALKVYPTEEAVRKPCCASEGSGDRVRGHPPICRGGSSAARELARHRSPR
jgi:uncharacterized protein (DUF58 family)